MCALVTAHSLEITLDQESLKGLRGVIAVWWRGRQEKLRRKLHRPLAGQLHRDREANSAHRATHFRSCPRSLCTNLKGQYRDPCTDRTLGFARFANRDCHIELYVLWFELVRVRSHPDGGID